MTTPKGTAWDSTLPSGDRFSRPALPADDAPPRPLTVLEARDAIVAASDRWRAEGSERAGWELDKAALRLIAVTYDAEGIL